MKKTDDCEEIGIDDLFKYARSLGNDLDSMDLTLIELSSKEDGEIGGYGLMRGGDENPMIICATRSLAMAVWGTLATVRMAILEEMMGDAEERDPALFN